MMDVHCGWHSFEKVDGSIPDRASKLGPGSPRTASLSSASTIRGAATAARKNGLFITERPRDELPS